MGPQYITRLFLALIPDKQRSSLDLNVASFSLKESHFIVSTHLQQEFLHLNPTTSILFTSNKGLFYVASDVTFPESTGNP